MGGTILIPGPQGQSSSSLANMSANATSTSPTSLAVVVVGTSSSYSIFLSNFTGVNITASSNVNTFTFNLTGTYLFQYNVNVFPTASCNLELLLNGTTAFGVNTIPFSLGSYGCSVIYQITAGNYVNLVINNSNPIITFASLTVIKL